LGDVRLGALTLGALYRFGFAPVRGLGAAEKAMTAPLEVEAPEGPIRCAMLFC
jgi:hypothetical protein